MDALNGLTTGLSVVADPANLLYIVLGVLLGMVVGILPGLGPTATIAILLPITFSLEPATSLMMLAGVYYGSMYGGTITSVLLNLPGEAASVVTTLDGYQMARKGRAGPALGIAAIGSFVGGIAGTLALLLVAAPLAVVAAKFGYPEFATMALLGLLFVTALSSGSTAKAFVAAGAGLLLAAVGLDPVSGSPRLTFGSTEMMGGIDFVALAMGVFGLGEVLYNLRHSGEPDVLTRKIRVWPSRAELRQSRGAIARGTGIGTVLGLVPGAGGTLSSLMSYALEKRVSKDPSRFGEGAIEGVAGPETANNAGATTSFVPLLTIGIPSNSVMALMFGALLIQGITPGPTLITEQPGVFWGVIASMFVGNLILLVLNLPLVGGFIQLLRVRIGVLGALTILVSMVGVYAVNVRSFDLFFVVVMGIVGYWMRRTGFPAGPLVLAFVLGDIIDQAVRSSLLVSRGDFSIFVTRPVSAAFLGLCVLVVVWQVVSRVRTARAVRGHRTDHTETAVPTETEGYR
ncbi:tripartite tricarboxylate transporter permease [Blastococcus sp. SYSU DS0533]